MSAARPVDAAEAAGLFGPLSGYRHVLLAVSGGADSTALMWLAARWKRQGAGPAVSVATVDHALRPEAADECATVMEQARALGLDCLIQRRAGPVLQTRIQEQARAARYALLAEAATTIGAQAIVTAHTLDDQAETVLMRLGHGSTVDGLAAMRPSGVLARAGGEALALIRPLLSLPKLRLVATLEAAGVGWIEDPSNTNLRFERVRVRRAMTGLADIGLTAPVLGLVARRAARAAEALDTVAATLFETLHLAAPGLITLDREGFLGAPEELRLRVLAKAIAKVVPPAPGAYPLRLERLEALAEALCSEELPIRRTLGAAIITLGADGPLAITAEGMRQRGKSGMKAE
jgi:tRNA(Ile)-lysidine synthase